jgi:hypothetical protein
MARSRGLGDVYKRQGEERGACKNLMVSFSGGRY